MKKGHTTRGRIKANLKVGDKVLWLRNMERENKMDVKRIGPFEVMRVIGDLDVEIGQVEGGPEVGRRGAKIEAVAARQLGCARV